MYYKTLVHSKHKCHSRNVEQFLWTVAKNKNNKKANNQLQEKNEKKGFQNPPRLVHEIHLEL